jgi:dUTPase
MSYQKGYEEDAALDIILNEKIEIKPGFSVIPLKGIYYTPELFEVAFIIPRGSTARNGIMTMMVAIDPGYTGELNAFVFNATNTTHYAEAGSRVFSIVNFEAAQIRAEYIVAKPGESRGDNKLGSSGGAL